MRTKLRATRPLLAVAAAALLLGAAHTAAAEEVFIPVLSYRTGPFAPNGVPLANGYVDYFKLINERDQGINGVKIALEECEFGYDTARGVECYERLKSRKPVAVWPLSTGLTFALTAKADDDKIPIFTMGYGRADSADGRVFPWNFPMVGTYFTAADVLIQHLAKLEKGSLKGKKIALVFHDSPYGKEPIPVLEEHAKRMGYEFLKLPVTSPGLEQKATWLQVRQQRPDYVLLWGWGVMNSTALKEAVAVNYPRSKMYGVWWSAAEPDVLPADSGAAGFNGLTLQQANETNNPVHRDVLKYVYEKGQGTGRREEIGTVLYNRGLQAAMLIVESIRSAQSKYGKRAVSGEEVRWGAENLNLDAARIKTMGFEGMMQPLKTSCSDHVGTTGARIHTWDGKTWRYSTDWYQADAAFLRPIIEASAQKYAEERKVRARDCSK